MGLVITISGLHGTGKTTYAKALSNSFNLRHISAGMLFRQKATEQGITISDLTCVAVKNDELDHLVDERTRVEAKRGNVVIDGLLAGWMAGEFADIKIYLTTSDDVRISRIARRDEVSISKARKATLFRERVERKRFKKIYGIDIDDVKIYDLILNTELLPIELNIDILRKFIQKHIKS